jgi:WD40 repeat protein
VLSDDETIAYSGSRDRCILKWDLKLEKRTFCHMQRMGGINNIILSRDESHILSVGQEKKLKYWHLSTADAVHQEFLENEDDEGRSISISQDGKFIAIGGTMGIVRLFRYETGKLITSIKGHSSTINALSFSPDDKQIVSVGEDGSIFIWCLFLADEESKK